MGRGVLELGHGAAEDGKIVVLLKPGKLPGAALGVADIIAVHPGDEFVAAVPQSCVQRRGKAPVLRHGYHVKGIGKPVAGGGDNGFQFRRKRAVADQHEIIGGDGLAEHAVYGLLQKGGVLPSIDGHQDRVGSIFTHFLVLLFLGWDDYRAGMGGEVTCFGVSCGRLILSVPRVKKLLI